jgi:hypothetical protein
MKLWNAKQNYKETGDFFSFEDFNNTLYYGLFNFFVGIVQLRVFYFSSG